MDKGSIRGWPFVAAVALLLGAVLRTLQCFDGGSLWFDELAIARNVEGRTLLELASRPLDHAQVAPAAWLALVKLGTLVFGTSNAAFRLVPWIGGITSLWLFWRVARALVRGPALAALALAFALSPTLIWYAGDVKPYSSDLAIGLLLVLRALRALEVRFDLKAAASAGALGAAIIPFSLPAVTTSMVIVTMLALAWLSGRLACPASSVGVLAAPWFVSALGTGLLARALVGHEIAAYMARFWIDGFMPPPWTGLASALWLPRQLCQALGYFLFWYLPEDVPSLNVLVVALGMAAAVGLASLGMRRPWVAICVVAPTLAAVAGAALHALPFRGRVGLFAGWPLVLGIGLALQAGLKGQRAWARYASHLLTGLFVLPGPAYMVFADAPPFHTQMVEPILAQIARQLQERDALVASEGARHAVNFYGPRAGLTEWKVLGCNRDNPRGTYRELDAFRGRSRVWLLVTHTALGYRDPDVILRYLRAIGVERAFLPDVEGMRGQDAAASWLFDLSDPRRLASTSAESFEFGEIYDGEPRIQCDGTRVLP